MCSRILERESITELTYKELKGMIDYNYLKARQRIRQLRRQGGTRFKKLQGSSMIFRTPSAEYTTNGKVYEQEVKLLDLPDLLKEPDTPLRDRAYRALHGNVALRCTCPAFLYWGFAYITFFYRSGAPGRTASRQWPAPVKKRPSAYPTQPWRRRNHMLRSVMCKHLALVMEVVGAHWNSLVRELKKQGYE